MTVRIAAPAKINLTLEVGARRADGYHEMKSVMQAVDLCDTVTLTANDSGEITLSITGAALPLDPSNTAFKAARVFLEYIGRPDYGVHIDLTKRIPMQAGMAGGSADAAAVLWGMNVLTGVSLLPDVLCALGAKVGADVPFCVMGGAAFASGIGTTLQAVTPLSDGWFVAVKPRVNVSTAEAYRATDSKDDLPCPDHEGMCCAMAQGDLSRVGALLENAFEDALQLPEVAALQAAMRKYAPLGCLMTGSGSVVYALFATETDARHCADGLRADYDEIYVCRPVAGGVKVL